MFVNSCFFSKFVHTPALNQFFTSTGFVSLVFLFFLSLLLLNFLHNINNFLFNLLFLPQRLFLHNSTLTFLMIGPISVLFFVSTGLALTALTFFLGCAVVENASLVWLVKLV